MPLVPCPACGKAPAVHSLATGCVRVFCDSPPCLETPIIRGATYTRAERAWQMYTDAMRPPPARMEKGTRGFPMQETTGLQWARDRTRAPIVMCIDDMSEPP